MVKCQKARGYGGGKGRGWRGGEKRPSSEKCDYVFGRKRLEMYYKARTDQTSLIYVKLNVRNTREK